MGRIEPILDTNILIGIFNQSFSAPVIASVKEQIQIGFGYSVVSRIEFLSFLGFTEQQKQNAFRLLAGGRVHLLDSRIEAHAIRVRAIYKLKLPDAIIAATALATGQPLLTADRRGFQAVAGLQVLRPEELT